MCAIITTADWVNKATGQADKAGRMVYTATGKKSLRAFGAFRITGIHINTDGGCYA